MASSTSQGEVVFANYILDIIKRTMEEGFENTNFLNDVYMRISTIEQKNKHLKERILILGKSFLKQEKRVNQEVLLMREDIRELREQVDRIKEAIQHLIRESEYFARKEQIRMLERYIKIWEPLKFVKKEEVEEMINNRIGKTKKNGK